MPQSPRRTKTSMVSSDFGCQIIIHRRDPTLNAVAETTATGNENSLLEHSVHCSASCQQIRETLTFTYPNLLLKSSYCFTEWSCLTDTCCYEKHHNHNSEFESNKRRTNIPYNKHTCSSTPVLRHTKSTPLVDSFSAK